MTTRIVRRLSFLLFLSVFCLISVDTLLAAEKICGYCKKPVQTTRFFEVDGNYYCATHFRCANCDKSIGGEKYFKEKDKHYDQTCYFELFGPRCAACSTIIDSRYVTFEGKSYHDSCYNNKVALHCTVCREIIEGQYITDYWGNQYHLSHRGHVPECVSCQRFVCAASDSGQMYFDGRWICGLCGKTAITTLEQMNQLVQEIRQSLLNKGIDVPFDAADNHLVYRGELAEIGNSNSLRFKGYAAFKESRVVFGLIPVDRQVDVYLLYGLPRAEAAYILSQSMMSLWLFRFGKKNAEQMLHTGSISYIGWLVMNDFTSKEAEYIRQSAEADTDFLYGEGFRRIRKFAESQSMDSFLKYLKKNKKMPAGN